jgi:hypothetical protein
MPSNAKIAPTTTTMMPIVQTIAMCARNPIISRIRDIHLTGLFEVSDSPGPARSRALDARRVAPLARRRGLCVPITSSTSCHQAIFVDQAADLSLSSDAVLAEVDRLG